MSRIEKLKELKKPGWDPTLYFGNRHNISAVSRVPDWLSSAQKASYSKGAEDRILKGRKKMLERYIRIRRAQKKFGLMNEKAKRLAFNQVKDMRE